MGYLCTVFKHSFVRIDDASGADLEKAFDGAAETAVFDGIYAAAIRAFTGVSGERKL